MPRDGSKVIKNQEGRSAGLVERNAGGGQAGKVGEIVGYVGGAVV